MGNRCSTKGTEISTDCVGIFFDSLENSVPDFLGIGVEPCGSLFCRSYSKSSHHHQSFRMRQLARWAKIKIFEGTEATLYINDTALKYGGSGSPYCEQKLAFPWITNIDKA